MHGVPFTRDCHKNFKILSGNSTLERAEGALSQCCEVEVAAVRGEKKASPEVQGMHTNYMPDLRSPVCSDAYLNSRSISE